jgi:hypothetical protein
VGEEKISIWAFEIWWGLLEFIWIKFPNPYEEILINLKDPIFCVP